MNFLRSLLLCLLAAIATQTYANGNQALSVKPVIKIGVTTTPYPPYWTGSVVLPQGLAHDIGLLIASQLQVEIAYLAFPTIADVKNAIKSGEVDLAIGYLKTDQRERDFIFSEPIYKEAVAGWISPEHRNHVEPNQLRWACLKGMSLCSILKENNFNNVIEVDDYDNFYEYLSQGKADAIIGFYSSFLNYFANNSIENQHLYFDHRFDDYDSHVILNKNNVVLRDKLDSLINNLSFKESLNVFEDFYRDYYYPKNLYTRWFNRDQRKILVRYTVDEDLFPYSYINESAKVSGYIHDVIERIEAMTPLEFEYIPSQGADLKNMLSEGVVDFIPIAKQSEYDSTTMQAIRSNIDVKYVLLKSLKDSDQEQYALLDRFNYTPKDKVPNGFRFFQNTDNLLQALADGDVSHAYINKYLVDRILRSDNEVPFQISSVMGKYNFNTKAYMLIRKDDLKLQELLQEAFTMLSKRELDSLWSTYDKVEYRYGYREETVNYIFFVLLLTFLFSSIGVYVFVSRMRKQVDGAHKKSELSEVHRRWLVDIIDNIPNYVCIRDESGTVELSNRSFRRLCRSIGQLNENELLEFIMDSAHVELRKDYSKHLHILDNTHPLSGKYFHVVNNQVTHYVGNVSLYMTVLTDITELKEKEQKLIKANKKAEASIQQKTNFLAVISHELRTPISGILGLMEMLEQRISDDLGQQILNNAAASTSKLKLLVDDILDFSKLDAQQLSINRDKHNLALELSPILKSFESLATRKGVGFHLNWIPTAYIISDVDFLRFSQIVSNVLSNAVKFTEYGSIVVKLRVTPEQLVLEIKDSGIGMEPQELEHIFDPFVQAQDNIARKYGGTGLGMSIVKNLVDLMQGTIEIKSAKDIGTSVHIQLPIASTGYAFPIASGELVSSSETMSNWLRAFDVDNSRVVEIPTYNDKRNVYPDDVIKLLTQEAMVGEGLDDSEPFAPLQGKVLVVEDDPINRFLVKLQLDTIGVEAVIVDQGDEALSLIRDSGIKFDVLLTDCHMPGMNGFELTRAVRNIDSDFATIPVIAFTADNSELITTKAAREGIESILYKPYELNDLYKVLNAVLPHSLDLKHVPLVDEHADNTLLGKFSEQDRMLMAQAVIDSMSLAVEQLNDEHGDIGAITHRLKGAAGALSISVVVELCEKLSESPHDRRLKITLIECLENILVEARKYIEQLATHK
ncbi:ATP-binding protein [Vibrio ponticus]|uniref:ATP-binding protein n=1 Tax=Vibrio ponticus TaxID=265668 RepID=UPI0011151792|nr:transporter substrate-binding domain-containing protein [Vibrio ponticus]